MILFTVHGCFLEKNNAHNAKNAVFFGILSAILHIVILDKVKIFLIFLKFYIHTIQHRICFKF